MRRILVVALLLATRAPVNACAFPMKAYLQEGMYGVDASLANTVLANGGLPRPEPQAKSGGMNVEGGIGRVTILEVISPETWHARFRKQILATNINNANLSPRERMLHAGDGYFVHFADSTGAKWWLPTDVFGDRHGQRLDATLKACAI